MVGGGLRGEEERVDRGVLPLESLAQLGHVYPVLGLQEQSMQRSERGDGARAAAGMLQANLQYLVQRDRVASIDVGDELLVGLLVAPVRRPSARKVVRRLLARVSSQYHSVASMEVGGRDHTPGISFL